MTAARPFAAALLLTLVAAAPARAQHTDEEREAAATAAQLAKKALAAGRYDDAREAIEDGLAVCPDATPLLALACDADLATGRYEAVRARGAALAGAAGGSPALLERMAEANLRLGRHDEAERALRRAVEADPKRRPSRAGLGELLVRRGKKEEARPILEKLLDEYTETEEGGDTAEDLVAWARACVALDRFPEVKRQYRRPLYEYANRLLTEAAAKDPDWSEAELRWGFIFLEKGSFNDARDCFLKLTQRNASDARAHLGLALCHLANLYGGTQRFQDAHRELEVALSVDASLVPALETRAELLLQDDDRAGAMADCDRALAVDPKAIGAHAVRAAVFSLSGDASGFAREEAAALASNPRAAEFYVKVAEIVERKFRYRDCEKLLEEALRIDEGYHPAATLLGQNLMRLGRETRAKEVLQKAFKDDPYNVYAKNSLEVLRVLERDFVTRETEHFIVRVHKKDEAALLPFVLELLDRARRELPRKYGVALDPAEGGKVLVEVFPDINDFGARSIGLPFIPALGVCFGRVVTLLSPRAMLNEKTGEVGFNWGRTAWHELTHVATLERTENRVPRWLTEGISVYEESRGRAEWQRDYDQAMIEALHHGRLLSIGELDAGFVKPRFPGQVMLSYYQGALTVEYVDRRFGFEKVLALLDGYRARTPPERIFAEVLGVTFAEFDAGFLAFAKEQFQAWKLKPPYDRADVERFRARVKAEPGVAQHYAELARAYLSLDKAADAEINAGLALKRDERCADAYAVLGALALRRKQPDLAKERLERALALGTTDAFSCHGELARIASKRQDADSVRKHYEAAAALFPRHANLQRGLAEVYRSLGLEGDEVRALEAAVLLDSKDCPSRLRLLDLYRKAGKEQELLDLCEGIESLNPYLPVPHRVRGELLLKRGDAAGAARCLEACLALDPGDAEAQEALAGLRREAEAEKEKAPAPPPRR